MLFCLRTLLILELHSSIDQQLAPSLYVLNCIQSYDTFCGAVLISAFVNEIDADEYEWVAPCLNVSHVRLTEL
jgi:hypothetical protein